MSLEAKSISNCFVSLFQTLLFRSHYIFIMKSAPEAPVVSAPSTSMNPFDNNINLSTKGGIYVWKTATDPNISLGHIALTVKNGDKFLAIMNRKCSEYQLNKLFWIPATSNGVPTNLWGVPRNNFCQYRNLLYNYHKLSEDQVTVLAFYNWGVNDAHCVKLNPFVTLALDFTVVDPEIQRTKE